MNEALQKLAEEAHRLNCESYDQMMRVKYGAGQVLGAHGCIGVLFSGHMTFIRQMIRSIKRNQKESKRILARKVLARSLLDEYSSGVRKGVRL